MRTAPLRLLQERAACCVLLLSALMVTGFWIYRGQAHRTNVYVYHPVEYRFAGTEVANGNGVLLYDGFRALSPGTHVLPFSKDGRDVAAVLHVPWPGGGDAYVQLHPADFVPIVQAQPQ